MTQPMFSNGKLEYQDGSVKEIQSQDVNVNGLNEERSTIMQYYYPETGLLSKCIHFCQNSHLICSSLGTCIIFVTCYADCLMIY